MLINQIKSNRLARYIIVGGTSYFFEIIILISLNTYFEINEIFSAGISFWFGFVISFAMQKLFAFQNKEKTIKDIATQSTLYGLLVLVNFIFTITFVFIFSPLMGLIVSRTVALIITTSWNFLAYSKLIFKTPNK